MIEQQTLVEIARMVREKEASAEEVLEAHLGRIERENPKLNAFVWVDGEGARAAARAGVDGPLGGVPVTVKDSFDVAGKATACGSRFLLDHIAGRDATAVARLRAAGAILLGKTNTPELLASYETDNFVTGRTVNPWDPERTPGGSSGGEAAAIAAYCSAGGLGSDGGGSIRVPAHFCGIVGFKPTLHRVPATGHFPPMNLPTGLVGSAGPMARTVADARALFEVMAGYDPKDALSTPEPGRQTWRKEWRIGVWPQFYSVPVDPGVAAGVARAAAALESAGFEVEEFRPSGLERAPNVWAFFFGELGQPQTREILGGREGEAHWTATENLRPASMLDPKMVVEQFAARDRMRALFEEQTREARVVLAPVSSIPAFRHRERRWEAGGRSINLFQAMMPATVVNLLGLPALALPAGRSAEGLPVGVQLIGRAFEDELVFEVGRRLEEALGGA